MEEGETLFPGGSTKINCRCDGGGCEGESVKILAPAGGPKAKIQKHKKQNKDKQTSKAQGEVCIAGLYLQKERKFDNVKHRLKEKGSETRKSNAPCTVTT